MSNKSFKSGWWSGFLMAIGCQGVNWLITPMSHPAASTLRTYAVIGQVILCLGIGLWLIWRQQAQVPTPA
jgi:hypothetical protein